MLGLKREQHGPRGGSQVQPRAQKMRQHLSDGASPRPSQEVSLTLRARIRSRSTSRSRAMVQGDTEPGKQSTGGSQDKKTQGQAPLWLYWSSALPQHSQEESEALFKLSLNTDPGLMGMGLARVTRPMSVFRALTYAGHILQSKAKLGGLFPLFYHPDPVEPLNLADSRAWAWHWSIPATAPPCL